MAKLLLGNGEDLAEGGHTSGVTTPSAFAILAQSAMRPMVKATDFSGCRVRAESRPRMELPAAAMASWMRDQIDIEGRRP